MSFQKDTCFFGSLHHCHRAECWSWFPLFIWFTDQMQTPGQFLRKNSIYLPASWRALFSGPGCSLHVGWCVCRLCLCSPWLWSALGSCKEKHHGNTKFESWTFVAPYTGARLMMSGFHCLYKLHRGTKPRPRPTWPYRTLPLPHMHSTHCCPLLQCEMSWVPST